MLLKVGDHELSKYQMHLVSVQDLLHTYNAKYTAAQWSQADQLDSCFVIMKILGATLMTTDSTIGTQALES